MGSFMDLDAFETGLLPLWLLAQGGDEAAYREALARIAARLRRFFARRLQALPDEVEDLVQETLLALHLQRGTWDPGFPVSSWVHAIARHKLVDLFRRRGRRRRCTSPSTTSTTRSTHRRSRPKARRGATWACCWATCRRRSRRPSC